MSFSKSMFFILLAFVLVGCNSKKEDKPEEVAIASEVALADVSSGNCLNIEKLSRVLQNPEFSVPAALMTTNLKAISEMPAAKLNYFSYATFNYKSSTMNELGLFTQTRQKDCKTVQMLSASEEVLTYDVTSSSDKEISIKLKDKFRDDMMAIQKTTLFERQQPYEITYKYESANHLSIVEKYRTVDPICTTKSSLSFEIHKDLQWASRRFELPQVYNLDPQYISQVKEAISSEIVALNPSLDSPENISLEAIQTVQRAPLKEELKLCTQ